MMKKGFLVLATILGLGISLRSEAVSPGGYPQGPMEYETPYGAPSYFRLDIIPGPRRTPPNIDRQYQPGDRGDFGPYRGAPYRPSEFYKYVTSEGGGASLRITTRDYRIVNRIRSTIYQSVMEVFRDQPVVVTQSDLPDGAKITILASGGYDGQYRIWSERSWSYITVDRATLVEMIRRFAERSMPVIYIDGTVVSWE